MEASIVIGALCTALGAVCGYFVRKEKKQDEANQQVCARLDRLESSFVKLTDLVSQLTATVASLTAIASANAEADEKQNATMATILDRALNCQQCFRGPLAKPVTEEK